MLNLTATRNPDLPYVRLPEIVREEVISSVSKQGFTPLEHYNIYSLSENRPVKTNILAFAHPTHRTPEYTGLTVYNAVNDYDDSLLVTLLSHSASPFYLINRESKFSLWGCAIRNKQPDPHPIQTNISHGQLASVLNDYEVDLQPQRIIDVKQGRDTFTLFPYIQPLQLSIWAANVNKDLLVKHFGSTVSLLRNLLSYRKSVAEEEKDILVTTLSVQLLGAIILADTGVLDDHMRLERPSLTELISSANKKFDRYFKLDLFRKYFLEADQAYQLLQQICYAGFLPDMLSELYVKAYSKKERKESGSYDTPFYLTRHIWKNIPVEYLPPQNRVIADMTCGWGSFLVAGHERLSGLKDMKGIQLRNQLYGNDKASFTAQLAGLGLLLATSEDSWNIECNDALEWPWLKNQQPNIIVGNPPFGGDRKKNLDDTSSTTTKARYERANRFFSYTLERLAPGGYLAMLMPRSFTIAEASPELRKKLLKTCDVSELWEMPSKVFDGPAQRTIVLFAQKKELETRSQFPVRVRTIQPSTLDAFKSDGVFTSSEFVSNHGRWDENARKSVGSKNNYLLDYKLILPEHKWEAIQKHCIKLINYAEIMRGATKGQKSEKKRWRDYKFPRQVHWFDNIKHAMPSSRQWYLDYSQSSTIIYPNELKEPCKNKNPSKDKEHIFEGIKVLVPYDSDPSWGKRIRVAIERKGYFVSDHFYIVTTNPTAKELNISNEVIAAILSWDVSNAWIIEHMRSPAIPKHAMDTIPFPKDLSEEDCKILTESVLVLEESARNNTSIYPTSVATQNIDKVLQKAYHLDNVTFARLRQIKEWDQHPLIPLDLQSKLDDNACLVSGIVDIVDPTQGTITLWLKGFDELQTIPIPSSIPGWMLRPETAFRTKLPYKFIKYGIITSDYSWGTFFPQPYAYISEEKLFEGFAALSRSE